ncbi:MAG: citrate lyase subunit alpha, partial [Firmicutes bacterium]|nr:citrate lyase subunit alpha [Bacillota bacterium]
MSKLVKSIKEAIQLAGLKDGMTISFHHHLRNGDMVAVMVMDAICELGIKDMNVNISSVFDTHGPFIEYIRDGVITGIETDYMGGVVGRAVSEGIMNKPVTFRTHGGRPSDIIRGASPIDVAFIAAPTADCMGNCTGKIG